jgi:hypothetical protein
MEGQDESETKAKNNKKRQTVGSVSSHSNAMDEEEDEADDMEDDEDEGVEDEAKEDETECLED